MSTVEEISDIASQNIKRLRYLLQLQNGDFYYMNSIKFEKKYLVYFEKNFPFSSVSLMKLGLNLGALTSYPIYGLNQWLSNLIALIHADQLQSEMPVDCALQNIEMAFKNKPQGTQTPRRVERSYSNLSINTESTYVSNTSAQASDTPKRSLKYSRSINDFNRLLNKKNRAHHTYSFSTNAASASASASASPTSPLPPLPTASPSDLHFHTTAAATAAATATATAAAAFPYSPSSPSLSLSPRQQDTPSSLSKRLRKMTSSTTLWNVSASQTQARFNELQERVSNDSAATAGANADIYGSMPVPPNLDNLLTFINLLKMFEKALVQVLEHVAREKHKLSDTKAAAAAAVADSHSVELCTALNEKLHKVLFEPVFRILDCIAENIVAKESTALVAMLSI